MWQMKYGCHPWKQKTKVYGTPLISTYILHVATGFRPTSILLVSTGIKCVDGVREGRIADKKMVTLKC